MLGRQTKQFTLAPIWQNIQFLFGHGDEYDDDNGHEKNYVVFPFIMMVLMIMRMLLMMIMLLTMMMI